MTTNNVRVDCYREQTVWRKKNHKFRRRSNIKVALSEKWQVYQMTPNDPRLEHYKVKVILNMCNHYPRVPGFALRLAISKILAFLALLDYVSRAN